MRDDHGFNVAFVRIVESFPVLYDFTEKDYSKKSVVEKVWAQIAEEVRDKLNEECTGEDCKNRWRGLRSSFVRFKNNWTASRKPYYLFEAMHFLQPFAKSRKPSPNTSCNSTSTLKTELCENVEVGIRYEDDWVERRRKELEEDEEWERRMIKRRKKESEERDNEDCAEMHFLKSLLPYLLALDLRQKLAFQMATLKLIEQLYSESRQPE